MSQATQALKEAMALIEQLPIEKQRQLAKQLLTRTCPDERALVVYLKQLPATTQERFTELMDKNNEGELTKAELRELRRLNHKADRMMLENSRALAQALRPELFDKAGRLIKRRLKTTKDRKLEPKTGKPQLTKRKSP